MVPRTDSKKNSVTVLGGGAWGTALAAILAENNERVIVWEFDKYLAEEVQTSRKNEKFLPGVLIPENVEISNDLQLSVASSKNILFVVPSHVVRSVAKQIAAFDLEGKNFISATKGIETDSLKRMSQVLEKELPGMSKDHIAVLSGPSFAKEVGLRHPTAVVAASENDALVSEVQRIFMCSSFRVYGSSDVAGVEFGGSLKNVMAIAAGIINGVGFGDNTKAAMISRGIVEMRRLGALLGADERTFSGLSGMGDLILTCMGSLSRNLYVGKEIGKGRKLQDILNEMVHVAEGVKTTQAVRKLKQHHDVETPIMDKVYEILFEDKDPKKATVELMTREAKAEH